MRVGARLVPNAAIGNGLHAEAKKKAPAGAGASLRSTPAGDGDYFASPGVRLSTMPCTVSLTLVAISLALSIIEVADFSADA